jgi:hypothetical protein
LGLPKWSHYWTQKTKTSLGDEMEEEEYKQAPSPGKASSTVIFEQMDNGTYLVFDRIEQKFQVINEAWRSYCHDGLEHVPLRRLPWPAAHLPKEESEEQLFTQIRGFFVDHLDVSNELLYDIYACFVLASWRAEDFPVVPYLFFLGPLSSGKTRALECFHRLCYRSIMATSMSASSLFRALEAWHPTLLLDETEIYNRESMIEVLALLNSGYRRGQYAIRIEKIEQGTPQIAMFDTFGFKVLAGTEELAATIQSRCIITTMSRAIRPVNLFIDEERARELRNKLLMHRFRNLGRKAQEIELNGQFQNARVIELFICLLQVAPSEEIRQRLLACMKQITQSRLEEEQVSIEARIFDSVLKCESKLEDGKLTTQAITDTFNDGLSEKEKATSRFVGRKLRALGFEKCRVGNKGQAGLFWDIKLVERLRMRYFPSTQKITSVTSETSETTATMDTTSPLAPLDAEVTEVDPAATISIQQVKSPSNAEVSEETELTEVNQKHIPKPSTEPTAKLEDLKSVYWSDDFYGWHACAICGYTKLTSWQAETFRGEKLWVCEDCKTEWERRQELAN